MSVAQEARIVPPAAASPADAMAAEDLRALAWLHEMERAPCSTGGVTPQRISANAIPAAL
jgi:hypothetical protein